jgi:hypothetical protein
MSDDDRGIQLVSYPRTKSIGLNIADKETALGLLAVMAEASALKTVNGVKTLDIGWLELFEGLDEAIKTVWPDCTCDLLCPVHHGDD